MEVITPDEKIKLEERLKVLRANRSVISTRIAEARELGDLKENAEYHAAREQQGLEEAEIRRLEERIATAQVINDDSPIAKDVVFLGSTVKLRDLDDNEEELYRLVGESTDNDQSEIIEVTVTSPMGEALMKSRVGETIRVSAPRGVKRFEIIELV